MILRRNYQIQEYDLYVGDSKLALFTIDTRNKNGVFKVIKNEPKIACQIGYFPSNVPSQQDIALKEFSARIEGRGQKRPKWKYGFTLDRSASLEGMGQARKWVLESSFVDKSLMRSKIAFDLLEQFRDDKSSPLIAPQSRFVEVILNRDYVGVYLLLEHIDKGFIGLEDFDKNEPFNALLFRAENRNANFSSVNTHPLKNDVYKYFPGKQQPAFKTDDPVKGWHSGFSQRHPDFEKYGEHWEAIEEFSRFAAKSPDSLFHQQVFKRLDRQSFIDLWILIQLIDDSDGLYQNRYIAKHKGEQAKWIIFPWDKDGIFGRNYKMDKRPYNEWLSTPLFGRCFTMASFRNAFIRKWRKLVDSGVISTDNIFKMIEQNADILEDSRERNFMRWPTDGSHYPDNWDFHREIAYMKTWTTKRIEWLDNYLRQVESVDRPVSIKGRQGRK